MRVWIAGLLLGMTLSVAAVAQGREIEGVISGQIEAFQADDFARAFTFASPSIQMIFRTPENFGRMVTGGYPMVWRPAEVEYLGMREERGAPVQRVQIVDAQGRVHMLDYYMIETPEGWKINGVELLKAEDFSA